jgi:hypothetical protein
MTTQTFVGPQDQEPISTKNAGDLNVFGDRPAIAVVTTVGDFPARASLR